MIAKKMTTCKKYKKTTRDTYKHKLSDFFVNFQGFFFRSTAFLKKKDTYAEDKGAKKTEIL